MQNFQGRSNPFWKRLSAYLFLAAALCGLWGQVWILNDSSAEGLGATLLGLVFLALALAGDTRLQQWMRSGAQAWRNISLRLKAWESRRAAGSATTVSGNRVPEQPIRSAAPAMPESSRGPAWTVGLSRRLAAVDIRIPKAWFLGLGGLLLLAAQPLLFLEKFFLAVVLVVPGLALLSTAYAARESHLRLGSLEKLLKLAFLGLPGLVLIGFGNAVLFKYVHLNGGRELLGIVCNSLGILLLLSLLPRILPDPEKSGGDPLDEFSGAAQSRRGVWFKIAAASAGLILLYISRETAIGPSLWRAFFFALAGIAALALSFPWALKRDQPPVESGPLLRWLINFGRLAAFGLALYLGYQGQSLIAKEELYAGLYRFAAAGLALIIAFREPAPGRPDALREQPLRWYWEALGLLALLAVGLWLRTYQIEAIPFGIEGDEAGAIINAREILNGPPFSVVAHFAGQPVFYLGPLKVVHQLLGLNNLGIKFMAMAYGMLNLLALYLLGRMFFGPRAALAATALLTCSRWHIHFSRFGYGNTLLILMLTLAFYFLAKGLQTRRKWQFVFSGMAMALALQTEVAARLLPLICLAILGFLSIGQRKFFQRNWQPLLALFLGVWLAGSAMFILYAKSSTALMGRAKSVSIFSEDPNAPRDIAAGFMSSLKASMTMLNWHGDTRTRHNGGLSGEPMLDFTTSILFGLGFCFSLYYWKRLKYFILLVWFMGFMSASIFAIEAPQAHRAFGIVPAIFLFAGAFLDRSRRLLQEALGTKAAAAGWLAFVILLAPIAKTNYHKYFDTIPAFDSNCCSEAKYINSLGPKWENFIMTAFLWQGHPPFQAFAPDISGRFFYTACDVAPVHLDTDKNICYSFVLEYPPLLPAIQYYYPQGELHVEKHPKYGTMFEAWKVTNEQMMATRGLTARYWRNTEWSGRPDLVRKDPNLDLNFEGRGWPLPGAGSVSWEGTIWIPHLGDYTFYLYGTDEANVTLGQTRTLSASNRNEAVATWRLGAGLHRIRGRARHVTPDGRVLLAWSCPEGIKHYSIYKSPYNEPFLKQAIPANHCFTYPEPSGLLGSYYHSPLWSGKPAHQQVDPALLFVFMGPPYGLETPLSGEWEGWLKIDQAGDYAFALENTGYGEVLLDQTTVVRNGNPPEGYVNNAVLRNPIPLQPGRHRVRVRWGIQNGFFFKFWWTPPNGQRAIVPPSVLQPIEE